MSGEVIAELVLVLNQFVAAEDLVCDEIGGGGPKLVHLFHSSIQETADWRRDKFPALHGGVGNLARQRLDQVPS